MTEKLNESSAAEGGGENLPDEIIAQAEAAIIGNSDAAIAAAVAARRKSEVRTLPDYSQYQEKLGPTRSAPAGSGSGLFRNQSRVSAININILSDDSNEAPPAYSEHHGQMQLSQDGLDTAANVTDDGRVDININQKTRKLSSLLVPALRNQLKLVEQEEETPLPPGYIPPALGGLPGQNPPPKLNVVIHVVGSRGDVQPFVALGKVLKSTYGHRVRLATHPTFQGFVEENGLEFFSIGGDPSELMAFMVKNPGLMPGFDSLKSGDVGKRRKGMEEIVLGCWRSCIEAGDGLGAPPARNNSEASAFAAGINMDTNPSERPFIADAIIANPPSFAHVHIAEKMGIPLHMMFTMPWSPTQQFPHPLANIQSSNAEVNMTNFMSYALVEMMTWQGLGDVINRFRERALGLDPISLIWAPGMLTRLRIPYTYCWSPALIPKPRDWGQHISISGFYFLSLASSYTPAPELAEFLAAGEPPVYIGFGSIVVDDPDAMTKMIFEAVKTAGVRALVSKGWGGLGADDLGIPDGVFMLGNVPHDWLFQHVSAVVHHGGAGTTAAGIATGKPTVVVPFFGDQPFWGAMVARAGAGPSPIPYKQLTAEKLAQAIQEALRPETLTKAEELGASIKEEKGCEVGGKAFHDMLNVDNLRCSLAPSRVAVWRVKRTQIRLSALSATVLAQEGLLNFGDLKLYRSREYEADDGPWDPITGGASALLGTIASLSMGVADFPIEIFKAVRNKTQKTPKEGTDSAPFSPSSSQRDLVQSPQEAPEYSFGVPSSGASTPPSSKVSYDESSFRPSAGSGSGTVTPNTNASSNERGNSLKEALRGTLNRSRSGSRGSRDRAGSRSEGRRSRSNSMLGAAKEVEPSQLTLENAVRSAKGVSRIVAAGVKSPMDFTLGIARGFHNAPKLYGDDTVRPHEKVTDFQSGIKAGVKEFGYGMYDGITGLVTQPMRGAEKEGAVGLWKGIGKGIGGLVLKPGAAVWGLPGYAFLGIHKEARKMFTSSVLNYTIAARTTQGYEDFKTSSPEECRDIIARWHVRKDELQASKQKQKHGSRSDEQDSNDAPRGFFQTRHLSSDERKKLKEERKAKRLEERNKVQSKDGKRSCPFCRRDKPHTHAPRAMQATRSETEIPNIPLEEQPSDEVADSGLETPKTDEELEFEAAIHASVLETSNGDPEQDRMIERAIRASVQELQRSQGSESDSQAALNRAIQASIAEAGRYRSATSKAKEAGAVEMTDEDAEHEALLAKAIQESLAQYQLAPADTARDVDTDDDENVKTAIEMSKNAHTSADHQIHDGDDEEDIKRAIQQSKEEHSRQKTEEEIVLEYVKKQSLAEEEHKKAVQGKQKDVPVDSEADEEALQQAIKESLKHAGQEGEASGS